MTNPMSIQHPTTPPLSLAVLAAWMNGCPASEAPFLKPDDFPDDRDKAVWRAMLQLEAQGVTADGVALVEQLKRTAALDHTDWEGYCAAIAKASELPSSLTITNNARTVHDNARRWESYREHIRQAGKALDLSVPLTPEDEPAMQVPSGLRVETAADALQPLQPLDYIIEPILARGSISTWYGEPGCKKTYSLLSLGISVAAGKEWLGFQTKQCRVLIVDEESGRQRLRLRIAEALRGALAGESTPLAFISQAGFRMDDQGSVRELSSLIQEQAAELVIIDSLASVSSGDENSKHDMQLVMSGLRQIAETTGAHVAVIHHSSKNGGSYRGSSVIKASCDLMVEVTSEDTSPYVNFRTEKNRDGLAAKWSAKAVWVNDAGQFYLEPMPGRTEEQEPLRKEKKPAASQLYVLRYLREHGESMITSIMQAADVCSPSAARQAIYRLTAAGAVRRVNADAGGQGTAAIYALVDTEKEADTGLILESVESTCLPP